MFPHLSLVIGTAGCTAERFVREVKVLVQCCDLLTVSDKTLLLSRLFICNRTPVPECSPDPLTSDPTC